MQAETEEIYSGTIEKPDKLTAIKLAINCSKYIHELRNDWDENKKNIVKETVDFIDAAYGQPNKFQVRSILDKAIIVYGRREQAEDIYDYLEENGLNCAVVLYNSAKYDGDIFDPCCGSGNLLAACAIAGAKPTNLYGNEIDPEILKICRSRLKKLDIPESHIKQGDATKDDVWFKTLSRSRKH